MEKRVQLDNTIGSFLKDLRIEAEETQQDVAAKTGLSASFVGFIELGKRLPSVVALKSYSDFYGVDYLHLLKLRKDTIFGTVDQLGLSTPVSILNEYVMLSQYNQYNPTTLLP